MLELERMEHVFHDRIAVVACGTQEIGKVPVADFLRARDSRTALAAKECVIAHDFRSTRGTGRAACDIGSAVDAEAGEQEIQDKIRNWHASIVGCIHLFSRVRSNAKCKNQNGK